MHIPELNQADQQLQQQLLAEQLISSAQLKKALLAREQAWSDACEEFAGTLCSLEPGRLVLRDFPSMRLQAEIPLAHQASPAWGQDLVFFDPDDGRLMHTTPAPAKPGLLITDDGCFYLSSEPGSLPCLGETLQLYGYGQLDSDLTLSPKGDLLFVSERFNGRLHLVSLVTHKLLTSLQIREPGSRAGIHLTFSADLRQAYLTDQVSSKLWMLDLGSWRLMPLQTGLGVLGNLMLAPNSSFLYLSVLAPEFRLVYFDLQSLSVLQDLELQGQAASTVFEAPVDLMALDPQGKRLLYLSSGEYDGDEAMLVHVIGLRQVRTLRRYAISDGSRPLALMPGYANPFWEISRKSLGDWLIELGLIKAETLARLRQASLRASIERESAAAAVSYQPPTAGEDPQALLKREAPPITLPPEADDVLVEMVVRAFYQESQKNLRQSPAEIQKLYQLAIDWRQSLERKYAIEARARHLLGKYSLQVLVTREVLLQEVDDRLEGRELPFRPSHRCPLCQASLRAPRVCGECGFQLEDPAWSMRREQLSAESCAELIPGQILLALPQAGQVLLLNAWHEVIHSYELKAQGLNEPCHALALPNRNYLICDRFSGRVVEISNHGQLLRELPHAFKEPVMASFYYQSPEDLRLLIVDRGADAVLEFEFDGRLSCSWSPAQGLGLKEPRDVQRTWNQTLLIADTGNQRVIEIERSGRIVSTWGAPAIKLLKPVMARRELNGDTLIVDAQRGQIVAYDESKVLKRNFVYWPPQDASGMPKDEPAPDRILVLQRELLALSRNYWMQISIALEQVRWVKPWTGQRRQQRALQIGSGQAESAGLALLRNIPFLKQASQEILELLENCLMAVECQAEDMLMHQGELGSVIYFLLEGQVEILKERNEKPVATLGPGSIFGEMALILSEPRIASVKAKSRCKLLQLERADFHQVIERFPEFSDYLRKLARERKALTHGYSHQKQQEVMRQVKSRMAIAKLKEHRFFADADEHLLETLADALRPVAFMPRHTIFSQQESGETMYFITRGKVDVLLEGSQEPVAQLQAGDVFGEMALILDQPRSATVRSDNYCQCFELDRATFEHIAGQYTSFQERLRELAAQRQELNQDLAEQLEAQAEAAALLAAAQAEAAAEIDAALTGGAEVLGSAPHMLCYLVSQRQNQLLALDGEGQILWQTGESLGLLHPARFHDQGNTIWLTDTGNDRVLALDADTREILREWGNHLLSLSHPRSAVPTPQGNLLIADEGNQRLVLASPAGNFLWEFTTPHEIMSPFYAEQTPQGSFLFCDSALHMVYEIEPRDKRVIWSYGSLLIAGHGPNELCEPGCVRRLNNGATLIADTGNSRLLLISPQGQLLRSYRGSKEIPLQRPIHCEMLPTGEVLVWSGLHDEIIRLDLAGDPVWRARLKQPVH